MKIAVITTVFNRVDTIKQAVDSVLSQSHYDIGLVVPDSGSTDSTLELLRASPDPRINLVSMPDSGIYNAINKGIAARLGECQGLRRGNVADPDCPS